MWKQGWREKIWSQMDQPWDIIIIGGGITGAGILREAANAGLRVLLVDASDFGYGTSSRSSKLIHGGYRYLRNKQYGVTYESVREREWMLREAEHLVSPLRFLRPSYTYNQDKHRNEGLFILLYDLMARRWDHQSHSPQEMLELYPPMLNEGLLGGFSFIDARMDDARLLLRIIREAVEDGGVAINYARVQGLLHQHNGSVCGVQLLDTSIPDGKTYEVRASVVINASGPWSDEIRSHVGAVAKIRKQRGSHLVLPRQKFPLSDTATMLLHPVDGRTMFCFPWEGVSIIGTTDLDHESQYESIQEEPFASEAEIAYMLEALHFTFPSIDITHSDVISTFSGLRPIISTGKSNPSDESRVHRVWEEEGLVTIGGGKYTIFRLMARDTLNYVSARLSGSPRFKARKGVFNPLPPVEELSAKAMPADQLASLLGRYGNETAQLLDAAGEQELQPIETLPNIWAELRWAARSEGVIHLDDLLLRRLRIGMTLPEGGSSHMQRIRSLVQDELGWDNSRWEQEELAYYQRWGQCYSPSPGKK
jgi:glycerol-3-phosphate dehydrogenase